MILTQEAISEALDNALANGYELVRWTDAAIADDLVSSNVDYEDIDPNELIPFIKEWKTEKGRG